MLMSWSSVVDDTHKTQTWWCEMFRLTAAAELAGPAAALRKEIIMSHKEIETGIAITDMHEQAMVGAELTDDELSQVAGGQMVVDVKSYDEDGNYVDHEIWFFD